MRPTPRTLSLKIRPSTLSLLHFQRQKKRLGMVVDEYGDILGLVALEDILEEIVGEFTSNLVEENEEITRHPTAAPPARAPSRFAI